MRSTIVSEHPLPSAPMKPVAPSVFLFLLGMIASTGAAGATVLGTDNATYYPDHGGWTNGSDGAVTGDAFGAWTFLNSGVGFTGTFLGDSTTLNSGTGGNINTGSIAMGSYGNGTGFNELIRPLNGALDPGQVFSIDLAVNFRNGNKGIDLRDSLNTQIFNFNVGSDMYAVNGAATGNGNLYADLPDNGYDANTVFTLSFTQIDLAGGTWTVTRSGGITDVDSGTYAGVPASFKLYVGTDGGGDPNNLFMNNMSIVPVPEPSVALLVGAGLAGVLFMRRRR
jgi:hypothetical protein